MPYHALHKTYTHFILLQPLEKESCSYLSSILALAAACQTATARATAGGSGGGSAAAAADDQEDDTGIDGLLGCPMLLPDTEAVSKHMTHNTPSTAFHYIRCANRCDAAARTLLCIAIVHTCAL
jgi:hypothetical protein